MRSADTRTGTPSAVLRASATRIEDTEAFATLRSLAHGKTLAVPESLLVKHILQLTRQADWPVQRAAMEALLRRCASVKDDELRIATRPRGGVVLGLYTTRRARGTARPYTTLLDSIDPIRGSCDCPDFLRSSLALCKHLLAVIDSLAARPKRFAGLMVMSAARPAANSLRLIWDPVRPLTGEGDWLARVRLIGRDRNRSGAPAPPARLARWFRSEGASTFVLADPHAGQPEERAALVAELLPSLDRPSAATRGGLTLHDPALRALLRAERERLAHVTADRNVGGELKRRLRTLRRKLYPYQHEGVQRFLATGRLLLADDMGLGKTAQAIAACHALWHAGRVRRGLIIAPASLKSQWLREWRLFTDAPVEIVEGGQEQRREFYDARRAGFLIANYEQVLRDLETMNAWAPEIVVLDEAQRIKNWATRTAACVKRLRPHYRLVLTGTPMENRLEELASIFEWVDDHALEPKWRLAPLHSVYGDGSKEASGARNLDTLRTRLAPCMLRRLRRDVLKQLPPRTDTVVPVELTEEQREAHDDLSQPIARLAATAQRRPLTQPEFLRLMSLLATQRMIANGMAQTQFTQMWPRIARVTRPDAALLRSLCSPKLLELREIVDQVAVQQERKVVVFSQWRRMLTLAHWVTRPLLADHGLRAVFFTGEERLNHRTRNLVGFHDDPMTRILFATDAGGVGLNLQRAASCCVNLELPWNPAVLEQRVGRIHRLGQPLPIEVYNLVSQDCIESRIASLVSDKRALFQGLFDGGSDEIRFERSGSFLSTIERIVEASPAPDPQEANESAADAPEASEREIEAVVSAADESGDVLRGPVIPADRVPSAAPTGEVLPAAEIRRLFTQLEISQTEQGRLRIEASPDAAASLVALFEGLAGLLRVKSTEG
ncbi:MAG: DEAD/DEAH box helicase [Candidatus Eisenbacteria bacterium]|nr:DEAD/DEAH box helicase [Candidatus Eisenbacteria bacterium]